MWKLWQRFLAYWRLSDKAICEQSVGMDDFNDYHDYPDSDNGGEPWHFYQHTCKRCGKKFVI